MTSLTRQHVVDAVQGENHVQQLRNPAATDLKYTTGMVFAITGRFININSYKTSEN